MGTPTASRIRPLPVGGFYLGKLNQYKIPPIPGKFCPRGPCENIAKHGPRGPTVALAAPPVAILVVTVFVCYAFGFSVVCCE